MQTMTSEDLLTVDEVARRLHVSTYTVRDWLRAGKLKGYKIGPTKAGWRIRAAELDEFVESGRPEAARSEE